MCPIAGHALPVQPTLHVIQMIKQDVPFALLSHCMKSVDHSTKQNNLNPDFLTTHLCVGGTAHFFNANQLHNEIVA